MLVTTKDLVQNCIRFYPNLLQNEVGTYKFFRWFPNPVFHLNFVKNKINYQKLLNECHLITFGWLILIFLREFWMASVFRELKYKNQSQNCPFVFKLMQKTLTFQPLWLNFPDYCPCSRFLYERYLLFCGNLQRSHYSTNLHQAQLKIHKFTFNRSPLFLRKQQRKSNRQYSNLISKTNIKYLDS